jgi:hypothetical protein
LCQERGHGRGERREKRGERREARDSKNSKKITSKHQKEDYLFPWYPWVVTKPFRLGKVFTALFFLFYDSPLFVYVHALSLSVFLSSNERKARE